MVQKPTKIDDIKRPGKTAPLPTSRPIVVTNRPMLTSDPMVVPATQETEGTEPTTAALRTAKLIKPLDSALHTDITTSETALDLKEPEPAKDSGSTVPELAVDIDALHEPKPPETESTTQVATAESDSKNDSESARPEVVDRPIATERPNDQSGPRLERDTEAELSAEEIAAAETKAKRDLELEQVIASGKYHVPINAVQRRRSRIHVALLCIIGVLLAVVLADVVIDAGFVKLPFTLPHTHFFSTTASDS